MLNDFEGLLRWDRLQTWIQEQPDLPGFGPVTEVTQLTGGSQNNIFRLERDGATMVLRRPPRHVRANSNDTMLREARVLAALSGSGVPHPEFYGVCADTDVIGVTFYLMEPIDGFTPRGVLPGQYGKDVEWRQALAFQIVEAAAKLSKVDPDAVGLTGFGKPERWVERQVDRWRSQLDGYRQLEGYPGPELPSVDEVGRWLDSHKPTETRIGIIHGDLQFANVMFAYDRPELVALVDWELSSLGDPLLDLGWILTSWDDPQDPPGHGLQVEPFEGFPSRAELVERYLSISGRDAEVVPWFFVLACYKLGIILEGSWARALAGQAPMETGERLHDTAVWLFKKAEQLLTQQG
jgi:aminoglycoside phosphotransferase (APT) family kinase protein